MPAPLASDYALPAYAQASPQDQVAFVLTQTSTGHFTFTADGDFIYLPVALFAELVTTAAAGNRTVILEWTDPSGNPLVRSVAPAVQGPGGDIAYSASPQVGAAISTGNQQQLTMPVYPLSAGMKFQISVVGFQAGDAFFTPQVTVLRYSTGPADTGPPVVSVPTPILL